jgi:hypothetical protein
MNRQFLGQNFHLLASCIVVAHPYLVVPLNVLTLSAETVEKVQLANYSNFYTLKNQQFTGHKNPQIAGFRVFRQTRYLPSISGSPKSF